MTLSRIYIYNSGDEEDRWSEGPRGNFYTTGTPDSFTLTKAATQLKIDGSGVFDSHASFISGPYRMDYYDSISINWSYGADTNGAGSTAIFGIDPSGNARFDEYNSSVSYTLGTVGSSVDTIDVSSLSGEYYIYITIETNGKTDFEYVYANQVYFSGDVPVGSSSYTNNDCLCMCAGNLGPMTGSGNITLGQCIASGLSGSPETNYGFLGESTYTLESISYELTAQASINGSGNSTLGALSITSFGGSSNNYGAVSFTLDSISINGSGGNFSTQYGLLTNSLNPLGVTASGSSSGISRYSVEWKRFTGKSCITLDKEYSGSTTTPSGDCFSMLKPDELRLKNGYGPLFYNECGCSINIPIYLNRITYQDVQLSVATYQPTINIDYSGVVVVPALSGIDYIHHTGLYTIPSGSDYCNFPVTLIDNSSVINNYFNVDIAYAKTRNICNNNTYTINIVLGSG